MYTVELDYNVTKRTEYFAALKRVLVQSKSINVMVNSEVLIGTTMSEAIDRVSINRCRYNRIRLCLYVQGTGVILRNCVT